MISKEVLERLFQSEIAQMNDHMEELWFAGQRMPGGFHQLDNLSPDPEVGWAYRLLEKFGTRDPYPGLPSFCALASSNMWIV